MRLCLLMIATLLGACPTESPIVVDGSVRDSSRDAPSGDASVDASPSPEACLERFSSYGLALQGSFVSDQRTLAGISLPVADNEVLSIWVDATALVAPTITDVSPSGVADVAVLYGLDCPTTRVEDCAEFWVPVSGKAYVEQLDPQADGVIRLQLGDVVFVPATVDLRDFDATIETTESCRYLSTLDVGARLSAAACPAPVCRLAERSRP